MKCKAKLYQIEKEKQEAELNKVEESKLKSSGEARSDLMYFTLIIW
jgi:hypothetical protein